MNVDTNLMEATISVKNDTAVVYEDLKAVLACYSGNKLIGVDMIDIDAGMNAENYSLVTNHQGSANAIKIFLWKMGNVYPVTETISYKITSVPVIDFEKSFANIGDSISFDVFEKKGNASVALEKDDYTLFCEDMMVDYDAKTVSFATAGLKTVSITTASGSASTRILVNDPADEISVKGTNVFTSDFTGENALATYYGNAHTPPRYSIEDVDGTKMLATLNSSQTLNTNRFGPELTDYIVEMEYNMVKPLAAGWDGIMIGLRANSSNDAYRVGYFERTKFDGTNLLYDRLGIGRSSSSNLSNVYYAEHSDSALGVQRDTFYKMRASICGDTIKATLYDMVGNVIGNETVNIADCDYTYKGAAAKGITSGKTQIGYHGIYARIKDIKIFNYNKVGEITLTASSDSVSIGESITLDTFAGDVKLDNVKYTAVSGFEISGNTAVAQESGSHMILAEYTDDAGKTKSSAIEIVVE